MSWSPTSEPQLIFRGVQALTEHHIRIGFGKIGSISQNRHADIAVISGDQTSGFLLDLRGAGMKVEVINFDRWVSWYSPHPATTIVKSAKRLWRIHEIMATGS